MSHPGRRTCNEYTMKNLNKAFLRVLVACAISQCVDALQFSPRLSDVYAVPDKPLWWTCSVLKAGQTAPVTFLWRFLDGDIAQDDTRIAYANGTLYFPKVSMLVCVCFRV